jgi:hypothetical protein
VNWIISALRHTKKFKALMLQLPNTITDHKEQWLFKVVWTARANTLLAVCADAPFSSKNRAISLWPIQIVRWRGVFPAWINITDSWWLEIARQKEKKIQLSNNNSRGLHSTVHHFQAITSFLSRKSG